MEALFNEKNRRSFCTGWKVVLPNFLPVENISFYSDKTVPTILCKHDGDCMEGQEVFYFLLKLIAEGYVHPSRILTTWQTWFPIPGGEHVKFSPYIPAGCCGFRLAMAKPKQQPYPEVDSDFDVRAVPFTTPCDHERCKWTDKLAYAVISAFASGLIPETYPNKGKGNLR